MTHLSRKRTIVIHFVLSLALLFAFAQNSTAADPVTINFDNLPAGTNVTNQYSQVTFSANGFSAGAGGPYGNNIYTRSFYRGGFYSNGIVSEDSYYHYPLRDVFLDFPIPVNNFSFYIFNSFDPYSYHLCYIDVYVNHNYYGRYEIYHNSPGSGPIYVNQLIGGVPTK